MYENKNYEWMESYHAPQSFLFGTETLYWFFTYKKLMNQGTQKDKLKLVELYNEGVNRVGPKIKSLPQLLFLLFSIGTNHEYACRKFIRETKLANYADNEKREREIHLIKLDREIRELDKKIYGYDPREKAMQDEMLEAELDAKHTKAQKTFIRDERNYNKRPSNDLVSKQKVLVSGEKNVQMVDGRVIPVHYRIFDKIQGFYTTIVWADNRPKQSNGVPIVSIDYSTKYAGDAGIYKCMEFLLRGEVHNVNIGKYDQHNNVSKKSVSVKNPKIDIDKINKALGIDDDSDDLNGDIF